MKILAIICMLAACAGAQTPWQLTTADLLTQKVEVRGIDATGLDYVDSEGNSHRLPMDRFVEMRRTLSEPDASSGWILLTEDGEHWAGSAGGLKGNELNWRTLLAGELQIQLPTVAHIVHAGSSLPPFAAGDEDVIHLANGDAVHGAISAMTDQQVSLQTSGAPANIAWSAIGEIDFARLPGTQAATQPSAKWQIDLDDGTVLYTPTLSWSGGGVGIIVAGHSSSIALSHVTAIEQLHGPVLFLASQTPAENVQTPLLGAPWPARFGADSDGHPDPQAISVRAYSQMAWVLPGGFKTFHAQYSIPAELSLADITVRIQIDGKIVYEQAHLHGGSLSPAIDLPLNDGRRLTLEVDTDNPYRTQGWLTWISPALVR